MTDQQFLMMVADMRNAQREYFRTRSDGAMRMAKTLEGRVDRELSERMRGQMSLFDGEERGK